MQITPLTCRALALITGLLLTHSATAQWLQRAAPLTGTTLSVPAPGLLWLQQNSFGTNALARSTDGGQTWTTRPGFTGTCVGLTADSVWGVEMPAPTIGANLAVSADGAQNWTHLPRGGTYPYSTSFSEITYLGFLADQRHGLCTGHPTVNVLWYTSNGGQTWTGMMPSGVPRITHLSEQGSYLWYASNDLTGTVMHSRDWGHSWQGYSASPGMYLRGLAFRDTLNGLTFNHLGDVFRTQDGGRTWLPITPTGPMHQGKLVSVPNSAAYVSTDQTGTSYSIDGGQTWIALTGAPGGQFVKFVSPQEGYLLDHAGAVYSWNGPAFPRFALGVSEESALPALQLTPNPTTGICQLSNDAPLRTVRVRDAVGRCVWESRPATLTATVDLSAVRPGLYLVEATAITGARRTLRLVRE